MDDASLGRWFGSTACPLIAGTFGPLANSFNFCALVQSWRDDSGGFSISDPAWLLAINSLSLVIGIIANLSLLLNMTGRARFSVAQPITTSGFFAASFILIALFICTSFDSFAGQPTVFLSQAYYYAIFAAGIYFLIACLNTITVVGAVRGKYDKQFVLDNNERTLMLQTISFMGFMIIGAAVFSKIEGWRYLDGFYWASFTLLTIGLGPYYPKTHLGRSLLMPYAIGGIFAVGLIIGSIRSMILESAKTKMQAQTAEKKRLEILREIEAKKHQFKSAIEARHFEFHTMRQIKRCAQLRYRYNSLTISILGTAILWFVGAVIFLYAEALQEWSYFEALYFTYGSLMTLGYGDFLPESNFGRVFFVLWGLLAIPALTVLISDLGDTFIKWFADLTNWMASTTILPKKGEEKRTAIKSNLKHIREDIVGRLGRKDAEVMSPAHDYSGHDSVGEILLKRLRNDDVSRWKAYATEDHSAEAIKDERFYHFVLVNEIIVLVKEWQFPDPKKYTFDEWCYFLKLLGKDAEGMSWMDRQSPLLSGREETDWVLGEFLGRLHMLRQPSLESTSGPMDATPISLRILQQVVADGQSENEKPSVNQSNGSTV